MRTQQENDRQGERRALDMRGLCSQKGAGCLSAWVLRSFYASVAFQLASLQSCTRELAQHANGNAPHVCAEVSDSSVHSFAASSKGSLRDAEEVSGR